jgi:hypothetical protein
MRAAIPPLGVTLGHLFTLPPTQAVATPVLPVAPALAQSPLFSPAIFLEIDSPPPRVFSI